MAVVTQIGCDDGVSNLEIENKGDGGPSGIIDFNGGCDGGDNVGSGDSSCEIVGGNVVVIGEDNSVVSDSVIVDNGEITQVIMKTDDAEKVTKDVDVGGIIDSDCNRVFTESSQVTDFSSESTPQPPEDSSSQVAITKLLPTKIRFGSFGYHNEAHNEHRCGVSNNSTVAVSNNSQEDGEKVTCKGVDGMDDTQTTDELPPYNYMVKIPKFEDENLNEQIKNAQLQYDDKRRCRDAISDEIQIKREIMRVHNEAYNAADLEIRTARQLVKLKRQELDRVQGVLKKLKTAISVEDIRSRIYELNHKIEHETLCLKDEKRFIQEIEQLKSMSDELESHMGSQNEIQQAVDQKDQKEELLENLKNELKTLKYNVSKAEAAAKAIEKTYSKELKMERELRVRFIAAEESRQEAYGHLNSLKKYLNDKNKIFHTYKEDLKLARHFASRGENDSFHYMCVNQVERFMEKWNTDEEFRKDYISRRNMYASRRQNTLDRPLCVLPNDMSQQISSNSVLIPDEINPIAEVSAVEIQKPVSSSTEKKSDYQTKEKVAAENKQMMNTEEPAKPTEMIDDKETQKTDESRNADELMKEETEAKLKEQRLLEEKMKENEAMERKKQKAEKAQTLVEMKAQKEAEHKEKVRLKRLRKRERKRAAKAGADAATSSSVNGVDIAESSESKEIENTNEEPLQPAPLHFLSKQQKPNLILQPSGVAVAIGNRRCWRLWWNLMIAVVLIILSAFSLS